MGHFRNKKVEERTCLICDSQDIENEEHFICVCTKYSQLRNDLYLKVENARFHGLSNENKLVYLVKYKWKELSMFIEKGWIKRTEMLNNCVWIEFNHCNIVSYLTNLYFVLCWNWVLSSWGLGRQCLYWNIYAVFVMIYLSL